MVFALVGLVVFFIAPSLLCSPILPNDLSIASGLSHAETEIGHIAVLHFVILAFERHEPFFLDGAVRAEPHKVVIFVDLRPDKTPFDIGMDLSRRLGGRRPLRDEPGPRLLRPRRKKTDQFEKPLPRPGQRREPRRGDARGIVIGLALLRRELDDFRLQLGAEDDHLRLLPGRALLQRP